MLTYMRPLQRDLNVTTVTGDSQQLNRQGEQPQTDSDTHVQLLKYSCMIHVHVSSHK